MESVVAGHMSVGALPRDVHFIYNSTLVELRNQQNNPDCKMTGISKLAAAQWHKLSEAKKKPFLDAFTREQPAHEEAMKTYKTSYAYKTFVKAKEQYEIEVEDWEEQRSD